MKLSRYKENVSNLVFRRGDPDPHIRIKLLVFFLIKTVGLIWFFRPTDSKA